MKKYIFYRLITITLISISCSGTNTRNFSYQGENQPRYEAIPDSNFLSTKKTNKSYFPLEVSTYSYTNFKESVENGYYPTKIYTEELLNSFAYNFDKPMNGKKMGLHLETAISPWNEKRKLIQIGINSIKEEKKEEVESPAKNIIFAVDTSGSMHGPDRIDLAKSSMQFFIQGLQSQDSVATIQYTDDANVILPPTGMKAKARILESISRLSESGGTNAWTGILLAYKLAREVKQNGRQTKIILITDGDFGGVNNEEFFSLVEKENRIGISLTILGFSTNNVNLMDALARKKKGEAYYINSIDQARKNLLNQTWLTRNNLASNMNIEVKFNTELVDSFRLIGYDKYKPSKEKPNYEAVNDYSFIALYEVITKTEAKQNELVTVRLNYKTEKGQTEEVKEILKDSNQLIWDASDNFRFAAGVAGLGMIVNQSKEKGNVDFNMVIHLIQAATSYDPDNTRKEFLGLINKLKHY